MMTAVNDLRFRVRSARSVGDDVQFVIEAFDSTLPYLASIGGGDMWGDQPFSQREGFEQEMVESVRQSEQNEDGIHVFIAEVESVDGSDPVKGIQGEKLPVRVAAAMTRESLPSYLTAREELGAEIEKGKTLIFLEVIVADHRTGSHHKGAGAALIEAVKRYGLARGKQTLYVDCWTGNNRQLNRYYENRGFASVQDFSFRRASGAIWPGTLFRMDLSN